jgi:hypothetical protein
MQSFWQDLQFGVRLLRKQPGFTLIAVLTLALGIGANTAIFSVVNGVLLRPSPYPGHERLLLVWSNFQTQGLTGLGLSQLEYVRLRSESKAFAQVGAFRGSTATLTGTGEPERVAAGLASANLFETLGVPIFRGRDFTPAEEEQRRNNVVVLSYGFWQRRFAADLGSADSTSEHYTAPARLLTVAKLNRSCHFRQRGMMACRLIIQNGFSRTSVGNEQGETLCKPSGKTCATARECCSKNPASR